MLRRPGMTAWIAAAASDAQPTATRAAWLARACEISESTVKVHMKTILRKVRCSNRTQLAIWALEQAPAYHAREESVAALRELKNVCVC